jgi:hypothetical protein
MPKTKKTQHTPGPWKVFDSDVNTGKHRSIWRADGCGTAIAKIHGDPRSARENTANANLIAAAPDLLAACEMGLREFSTTDIFSENAEALDMMHAAIAKAKGGAK